MTKPDHIPKDIWQTACNTLNKMSNKAAGEDDRIILAHTIMASYAVGWKAALESQEARK